MVRHLLDRGADPTLRDAAGKSALDVAREPVPDSITAEQQKTRLATGRKAVAAVLESVLAARQGAGSR